MGGAKTLWTVCICLGVILSMLVAMQRLPTLQMTTTKTFATAAEYVGWELDPNWKPEGRIENTTYPKICNPQPMWSNQGSAELIKMNHDETGKNITDFNYATANYSALRDKAAVDETLEVPERDTAGNASLHKWELKSTPKIYNAAVCKLHSNVGALLQHFAHTMDEIYKCFDYWMEFAINNSLETIMARPVLLYHRKTQEEHLIDIGFQKTSFMKGIQNFLETQIGLKVLAVDEYYDCHLRHHKISKNDSISGNKMKLLCDEIYHPKQTVRTIKRVSKGYLFEHVHKWNILIDRYLVANDKMNNTTKPTVTYNNNVCSRPPRIGILNRKRTRSVLNSEDLAQDLSNMKYVYESDAQQDGKNDRQENFRTTHRRHSKQPVTVTYFENKDFAEQIRFFRNTDILISPHGAQLTGLPFMANGYGTTPNITAVTAANASIHNGGTIKSDINGLSASCKQVLEFFPKNYAIPFYFGTLAVQSDLNHAYVYFDYGEEDNTTDSGERERNVDNQSFPPPRHVMPWEDVVSPIYMERSIARQFNFCPRTDDFIAYVAELVMDWYRCHGCI